MLRESIREGKITALKSGAIRALVDDGALQLDLFDERNLYEFAHEDDPGERQIVCRNSQLATLRAAKRRDLLKATVAQLDTVKHDSEDRGRAHLFLCMLAYDVKWHMSEAWRGLLFADLKAGSSV